MAESKKSSKPWKKAGRVLLTVLAAMSVTAVIVSILVLRFFPVMKIFGNSMSSTLFDGDVVIARKTDTPKRGDICVFSLNDTILCKRVIGIGGDEISIDENGSVYVNGSLLDEPYLSGSSLGTSTVEYPVTVPENSYFVLGDNRRTSIDSRSTAVGCVKSSQIEGTVLLRLLPTPAIPE